MSNLFVDDEEGEGAEAAGEEEEVLDPLDPANLPTFEELLAALPCEPDARVSEEERMAEAYYNAGLDYRENSATTKRRLKLGGTHRAARQLCVSPHGTLPVVPDLLGARNRGELPEPILRRLQQPILGRRDRSPLPWQRVGPID